MPEDLQLGGGVIGALTATPGLSARQTHSKGTPERHKVSKIPSGSGNHPKAPTRL